MRFFGLKTCDTSRKTLAALRAAGHAPAVIDVRDDGIAPADAAAMAAALGEGVVNRASATRRALPPEAREGTPAELIVAHPLLMKRPVIEQDGKWVAGRDAMALAGPG